MDMDLKEQIDIYWTHLQAFKGDFMQPEIVLGQWLDRDHLDGCEYDERGFYARLSASGFLDCTAWAGPFKTDREAMAYLYEAYAREDA
jgi:hypothetical protein